MEKLEANYRKFVSRNAILLGFFAAYGGATAVFQMISKIPPWQDGSPIDILTGSMIWACCIIALVLAILSLDRPWQSLVWLAASACLGIVALDELFGMHEHAVKIRDDDDPKIVMALIAGVGLYILSRVQGIRGKPLFLLVQGFAIHCLYLLSDLGDGDVFDVTFGNPDGLRVIEEILEFSAMASYLAAFLLILIAAARAPAAAPVRGV